MGSKKKAATKKKSAPKTKLDSKGNVIVDDGHEQVIGRSSTDHGTCKDCGELVDVVVARDQCVGLNTFVCVECKIKRVQAKAKADIDGLKSDAQQARDDAAQQHLKFPK